MPLLQKPNLLAFPKKPGAKFFSRAKPSVGLWTVANRKPVMSKKEKPSPLKKLLKAWTSAGPEDRQAFLDLVLAEVRGKAAEPASPAAEPVPEDAAAITVASDAAPASAKSAMAAAKATPWSP